MTGRENIYTNASIFGLKKKEIDSRLEKIIEFSELGEFIDNPVRTYSSGMYMRLAFSVAINVDADILLIDEILAVGDASFQAKCFNKMQEIKREGKTIVIVSHDTGSIERLCTRAVWIDKGHVKKDGNPHDVIALYIDQIMNKDKDNEKENDETSVSEEKQVNTKKDENRTGNKYIEIKKVRMLAGEEETYNFKPEDKVKIEIQYVRNNKDIFESEAGIGIFRNDGLNCYGTNTYIDNAGKIQIKDSGTIEVILDPIQLLEGNYTLDVALHDEYGTPYDYIRKIKSFNVYSNLKDSGVMRIKHKFISK